MEKRMNKSLEFQLLRIRFSMARSGADRIHYVNEDDVRVVLSRLPFELWHVFALFTSMIARVDHEWRAMSLTGIAK
jgi:hypothetical protein